MSEGAIARNALGFILAHSFEQDTQSALRKVLQAARPSPAQSFWELAADAGHNNETIKRLCTGLFLLFAWGNLVDDMADAECDYIENPERMGPVISFLLRCLADEYLLQEAKVAPNVLARVNHLFAMAASLGIKELGTKHWDAERWIEVTQGIAGMQYQAYLQLLWNQTELECIAEDVGTKVGLVSSYYYDLESDDPRLCSLSDTEQQKSEQYIDEQVESLREMADEHNIPSLLMLLPHLDWRQTNVGCR